jgi:D-amino peptidase
MKILISSDMEGTVGVVDWDQVTAGGHQFDYYTGLLTKEIIAAIEGAMRAGATEFLVNDSHSKMANLRPDALSGSARYLSGRFKPMYMMQGPRRVPHGAPPTPLMTFGPCERLARRTELFCDG